MLKDCIPASIASAPLNPTRRVNYEFGMVLGVTDFRQEQTHFEWKGQLSNRLLHGYGTVSGLRVTAEGVQNPDGVQIRVSSGYAVSPQGRWMWIENDLCARLDEWVAANRDQLSSPPPGPGPQTLYVVLCYDECPTELVPVAGKACASDQDTRVPSRIQEAYQARFAWQKPEQLAEDSVRRFGELMSRVVLVPDSSPPLPDDSQLLLDTVLALATPAGLLLPASPPDSGPLILNEETACETIRQALAHWTTRVHPQLHPASFGPHRPDQPDCLLLACIEIELDALGNLIYSLAPDGTLAPGDVQVDDCDRPVLVPDRLKQELFCIMAGGKGATGATGPAGDPGPPVPPALPVQPARLAQPVVRGRRDKRAPPARRWRRFWRNWSHGRNGSHRPYWSHGANGSDGSDRCHRIDWQARHPRCHRPRSEPDLHQFRHDAGGNRQRTPGDDRTG